MNSKDCTERTSDDAADAVGIVVQSGSNEPRRPRVLAFVWGGRVQRGPSLPYGRWKNGVRPAA